MLTGWLTLRRLGLFAFSAVLVAALTGCDNDVKAQNEALYKENQELHDKLKSTQDALTAAEADRAKLTEQISKASTLTTPGSEPTPVGPAGAARANKGIGDFGPDATVTNEARGIVVKVAGDVLFDSGKAAIKTTAKKTLDKVAAAIQSQYGGNVVRVEGHTDTDPIRKSSWPSNQALSEARAKAVQQYLASKGVGHTTAIGMGSSNPKSTKALSRRVEIVIVK